MDKFALLGLALFLTIIVSAVTVVSVHLLLRGGGLLP